MIPLTNLLSKRLSDLGRLPQNIAIQTCYKATITQGGMHQFCRDIAL
jgi:hypothetical protein